MDIKILGSGCAKCKTLEKLTREVVEQNGFNATITKVEDIVDIMKYNIMSTPALVVNEKVEIKGRIPSADEIKQVLSKY
ncbi:MAG: thioredoxin family protein [Bacteroidota bacterium]|nr:thioredoxin family protein [Bacteroidota bacterium]